jgi:hypothetical protein
MFWVTGRYSGCGSIESGDGRVKCAAGHKERPEAADDGSVHPVIIFFVTMKVKRAHHREISYAAAKRVCHQYATLLTEFRLTSSRCGRSASFAKSVSGIL